MTKQFISREGSLGATVDTWTVLSTLGSKTAPGPLFVPPWAHKIRSISYGVGDSVPTAAAVGTNIVMRLEGGLKDTDKQDFTLDGYNNLWATAGANGQPGKKVKRIVDIDVKPGEIMAISAMPTGGVCAGEPHLILTLGFASG